MVLGHFAISKFVCVLKYVLSGFHDAKLTVVVAGLVFVRVEEWPALGHFKSVERHTIVLGLVDLQGEREQVRSIWLIVVIWVRNVVCQENCAITEWHVVFEPDDSAGSYDLIFLDFHVSFMIQIDVADIVRANDSHDLELLIDGEVFLDIISFADRSII